MNLSEILAMAMNEIQAETEQLEANRHGYADLTFNNHHYMSNPILLTDGRPDWVHDLDLIAIDNYNPSKFAREIDEDEWNNLFAISVMDREYNPYYKSATEDEEDSSEQEPAPQPHLMLYNSIDAYGQTHLGMAAGMAVSWEDVEENLSAPNMEIVQIFDMEEADNFFKQIKEIKKHFKKLKGLSDAE